MKSGFTTLAKLLAICFTLALLGGYVAWRVSEQKKDKERLEALNAAEQKAIATMRENIAKDQAEAEQALKQIQEAKALEEAIIMSGSKSGVVMPGSKVGMVIDIDKLLEENPELRKQLEESAKEPKEQMPKDEEGNPFSPSKDRVLLPGSKAPDSILLPRDQRDGK